MTGMCASLYNVIFSQAVQIHTSKYMYINTLIYTEAGLCSSVQISDSKNLLCNYSTFLDLFLIRLSETVDRDLDTLT